MPSIILPRRFYSQPQGAVEVDWSNPHTLDLLEAHAPNRQAYDMQAATIVAAREGVGFRVAASTGGVKIEDQRLIAGLDYSTALAVFDRSVATTHPNGRPFYCERSENNDIYKFGLGASTTSAVSFVFRNNAGNLINNATSVAINTAKMASVAALVTNGPASRTIYCDRNFATNTSNFPNTFSHANARRIGGDKVDTDAAYNGYVLGVFLWQRALSIDELNEIERNPWQLFRAKKRVLYFDTGVVPTTVTSDLTDNYAVRNIVSSDIADNYVVRNIITSDLTDSYALRSAVTTDLTDSYTLTNFVQTDLTDSYALRSVVTSDLTDSYTLTNFVQTDLTDSYALRSAVTSDLTDSYALRSAVTSDLTDSYDIVVAGTVTSDHTDTYTVRNTVISDHDDTYSVHNVVNSDFVDMYSLRNFVQNDIADSYTLTNFVQTDYSDNYDLRNLVNNDFVDSYLLRNVTLSDISDSYAIYAYIQNDIADSYIVNSDAPFTQVQLDYLLAYMQENLMIPTAEEIAAAILAAAQLTPIHADIQKVNNVDVGGTGSELDPWGPQ